jgi:hypothetical protein
MKQLITNFLMHKDLYIVSASLGTIFASIIGAINQITPLYLFGINSTLWLIALGINIVDIHTGIKADTKRKNDLGKPFTFESGRGWRAFEKIFIFTIIIWFIYTLEIETLRLELFGFISSILLAIKFTMLIYVVLIELQSIGENEQVRFDKKSRLFILLDEIIKIVNEGILNKIKSLLKG